MVVLSATLAASLALGSAPEPAPLVYAAPDDQDATAAAAAPPPPAVPPPPAAPAPDAAPAAKPAAASATKPGGPNEIVVSGERKIEKIDPIQNVNKMSFAVLEGVDKAFVGPVAGVYRKGLPKPVRDGLHNFFYNLTEPTNIINYMLQLHPGKAMKVVARMGINTLIGVGGVFDIAKRPPFNMHYRPNGFGNTLGYYGVGPGPYMFLPLVGPTSLRDFAGSLAGQAVLPLIFEGPFNNFYYVTAAGIVTQLDYRVIIDDDLNKVRKAASPYATYRQLYLKTRYEEIEALHGRGPLAKGEVGESPFAKPLYPEAETPPPPAAAPPATPAPEAAPAPAPVPAPPAPPPAPVFISQPVVQPLPAHP